MTFFWGIFLACSWTWCIGMFLPHVLLGRWGWAGFLVFAIPNVLGCAAMGYVVRSADRSRAMCERHATAARWFSLVTIGYHAYFAAFACRFLAPVDTATSLAFIAPIGLLIAGTLVARLPAKAWLPFAALVYALSLMTLGSLGWQPIEHALQHAGTHSRADLMMTAPVIIIGFLLCPYLDLTFHRARQHTPSGHAFAVFGVTFAIMLLLTCAYAGLPTGLAASLVAAHVAVQALFTVAAHIRELGEPAEDAPLRPTASPVWLLLALAPALLVLVTALFEDAAGAGEDLYLRFLVFYGLLAPAYVLVFMTRRAAGLTARSLRAFTVVMIVLMPMYELGYLHDGWAWLLLVPAGVCVTWIATQRARPIANAAPA